MDHSVHENMNHDHAKHIMDASTEFPVLHDHMSPTGGSGGMDHSAHAGHDMMGHMMSMAVGYT